MCELALSLPDRLDKNDLMARVFHSAVVVTYGRPFTRSKGIGKLEDDWTTFLDDAHLQDTHMRVMDQRNQVAAHADLKWRPLYLVPAGTHMPSGLVMTEPKITSVQPILEPVSFEAIRLLCLHLLPRLNVAFDTLFREVFPHGAGDIPIRLLPPADGEEEWINIEVTRS